MVAASVGALGWWLATRDRGLPDLPPPGPGIQDKAPALAIGNPRAGREFDEPADVAANPSGRPKVRHDDPVHLLQDYHQAVDRKDGEAITECYVPERRRGVAGMLGVVPRSIEWQRLSYELAELDADRAFVRVRGKAVHIDGKAHDVDERVKLCKVRGHWYLDDL